MREIKFRAWNKEADKMIFPEDVDCHFELSDTGLNVLDLTQDPDDFGFSHFDVELMQYTGLKDKNGVEIYEGDVVKITDCKYGNKFRGEISFKNGSYVVESNIATHYRFIDYHIEVIGNIYENPELLETKKSS